jgi:hypothetical protein
MTDTTYNGWTNRATWLVALWMGEEDFIGEQQHNLASEISTGDVRAEIEAWVDHQRQFGQNAEYGFIQDMEGEDFASIDYNDIAESFTDDINSALEG